MSINITTTHTITCENAPVEDVLKELQEKCPEVGQAQTSTVIQLMEDKDRLTRERDVAWNENAILQRDNGFAMRRIDDLVGNVGRRISRIIQLKADVDHLTRERDEVQKRLEESWAIKEKLIAENVNLEAANEVILSGGSRPALPKGMRLADHEEYGRVVVSPGVDDEGDYKVFVIEESASCKADYEYAAPSELTFLEEEPAPAPLPKPKDCKEEDVYRAKMDYNGQRGFGVAVRCNPEDFYTPWSVTLDDGDHWWVDDSAVTLLARLLPDREVQA